MKQSNTSHNLKTEFGGILQPIISSFENDPRVRGKLVGKEVILNNRKDIKGIIALDAKDDIHLLISPYLNGNNTQLNFTLKGLRIADMQWSVAGLPLQHYLDISCSTGELPSFKRPFLRYAEDVLHELSVTGLDAHEAVYRTSMRWKKFWSPEVSSEVRTEWIHGLFGELLFLTDIIERFGNVAIHSWTGPLGKAHDFQSGNELGVEIKTSVDVPFVINCNIHQLDNSLFKNLYIICYKLTTSEKGTTITELVERIEEQLSNDDNARDAFYEKLSLAGYQLHMDTIYNKVKLLYSKAAVFKVDKHFPKITEKSFIKAPDHRIKGIKYSLTLSGLEELSIDNIYKDLGKLRI